VPLFTEHSREYPDKGWWLVQHVWTFELAVHVSTLIEEDGGPPMAHASGYGDFYERPMVEHTFTQDYVLPDGVNIEKGDRARFWREQIGVRSPVEDEPRKE
jgi:hypothetical protein